MMKLRKRTSVLTYVAIGVAVLMALWAILFMYISTRQTVSEGTVERFSDIPWIGNSLDNFHNSTVIRYRCRETYRAVYIIFATTVKPGALDEILKLKSHPDWFVETGWEEPPVHLPDDFREFAPEVVNRWSTQHYYISGKHGEELFYDPDRKQLWGNYNLNRSRTGGR